MNRSRGRGRGGYQFNRLRPRGQFQNGVWHCDCDPRLPAEYFRVRKEGRNQGRWFYTCQQPEGERCGFFLWETDAKPREAPAILGDSREPAPAAPSPPRGETMRSPPPPYQPVEQTGPGVESEHPETNEHSTPSVFRSNGEGSNWRPDQRDDDRHADARSYSRSRNERDDTTSTHHHSPYETPTGKRKWDAYTRDEAGGNGIGLETPITGTTGGRFRDAEASSSPSKRLFVPDSFDLEDDLFPPTPSPVRTRGASATAISGSVHTTPSKHAHPSIIGELDGIVKDLFHTFQEINAARYDGPNSPSAERVKRSLMPWAMRMEGVIRGREVSRLAVKAKDAKIVELSHRITTLEAELETEKAIVQQLKWERDALDSQQH
ncbi:hypothetical protein P152DRAFT_457007 [Eremomyces bilateralis CBS 781.70]|uniref:GRF-type domain-containing protein n=1 Tax=Eremomyces bilateralis CBS 781.70 TaxID=1392243 RepID=A0A6G1G6W3_9PEZI|nr:uncharacterized protein P152DRAFT_457007 [Eremomyces bilateralis CBS 781.70]KAF1813630.1 hypothetical protein P152DRAFT_457007 [Eremomyces bilateralis CBS 781.70]